MSPEAGGLRLQDRYIFLVHAFLHVLAKPTRYAIASFRSSCSFYIARKDRLQLISRLCRRLVRIYRNLLLQWSDRVRNISWVQCIIAHALCDIWKVLSRCLAQITSCSSSCLLEQKSVTSFNLKKELFRKRDCITVHYISHSPCAVEHFSIQFTSGHCQFRSMCARIRSK
jgi:hypothetical protein